MQQRYQMLRVVQGIYRVLAWIGGVLGVIMALGVLVGGGQMGPYMGRGGGAAAFFGFLVALLGTALYWVSMMAAAEWISVVIDTEENTRNTAALLQRAQQPAGPQPGAPGLAP